MKTTDKWLKIYLENAGYKSRGSYNVEHEGETFSYLKTIGDYTIYFNYHWEDEMGHKYYDGRLVIYHSFMPESEFLSPLGLIEIDHITSDFIENLPEYERRLINAKTGLKF